MNLSESLKSDKVNQKLHLQQSTWLYKIIVIIINFFTFHSFFPEDYIRYAYGLISDYIPKELSDDLSKYLK